MKLYYTFMVEQGLTFEYHNRTTGDLEILPITEAVLGDPQYTRPAIKAIIGYGLPELKAKKGGEPARIADALGKVGRGLHWWATKPVFSVLDIASMSDVELRGSHAQWLGPKRIGYFRQAWQNFQKLRTTTLPPQ